MLASRTLASLVAFVAIACSGALAQGESHTVTFNNRCGMGTNGNVLSTGGQYTSPGPLVGGIAYLQTGNCGANGENCLTVEMTLRNPQSPGAGSSTDLTLIPPHEFSVTTGFAYTNGCDGQGHTCSAQNCDTAFHQPNDNNALQCEVNNVGLTITFC
ncbi:glycopeptide [Vararia minispora EC-137]|uniref:Glycopeptide n=1 Tax=Vararia minispora EC-137 TaxID=1314806 RepID=A0ACB8QQI2_9AGAM|nr:glycopeptide [Vararia minispora EC-137]